MQPTWMSTPPPELVDFWCLGGSRLGRSSLFAFHHYSGHGQWMAEAGRVAPRTDPPHKAAFGSPFLLVLHDTADAPPNALTRYMGQNTRRPHATRGATSAVTRPAHRPTVPGPRRNGGASPGHRLPANSSAPHSWRFGKGGPGEVGIERSQLDQVNVRFRYAFPPHSVTAIEIRHAP
jgi:hypothetical protein